MKHGIILKRSQKMSEQTFENQWIKIIYRDRKTGKINSIQGNNGYDIEYLEKLKENFNNVEKNDRTCEIYEFNEVEKWLWGIATLEDSEKNKIENCINELDDKAEEIRDLVYKIQELF